MTMALIPDRNRISWATTSDWCLPLPWAASRRSYSCPGEQGCTHLGLGVGPYDQDTARPMGPANRSPDAKRIPQWLHGIQMPGRRGCRGGLLHGSQRSGSPCSRCSPCSLHFPACTRMYARPQAHACMSGHCRQGNSLPRPDDPRAWAWSAASHGHDPATARGSVGRPFRLSRSRWRLSFSQPAPQ